MWPTKAAGPNSRPQTSTRTPRLVLITRPPSAPWLTWMGRRPRLPMLDPPPLLCFTLSLTQTLPKDGFSRPITLIESPQALTGTLRGTCTRLPLKTPGAPLAGRPTDTAVSGYGEGECCGDGEDGFEGYHMHRSCLAWRMLVGKGGNLLT